MAQDSDYQSYLDLERRSGESQPDLQWIPLPPPSVLQPYEPAPTSLAPPGYSQRLPAGSMQSSPQLLAGLLYSFPSLSGSMPTLMPASASTSQAQTQSRMRPGSQVNSVDIKYLSSPPGISQLSFPSGPPLPSIESHLAQPLPLQTTLAMTQPGPSASTATLGRTRGGSLLLVATNGPTSPVTTLQPSPTSAMSINFKGSRNAKCLPTGAHGKREWSAGFSFHASNEESQAVWRGGVPVLYMGGTKGGSTIYLSSIYLILRAARPYATVIVLCIAA
uniref:Uncharacterized protein n=1 Tax=Moniliophthora roreri TaxID=221103 RepID=A0A0W0EXX2_MONRR